jgi:Uma2 family endonuclease
MNRPVLPRIDIPLMSIEAFEVWVARQDGRYELVRGRPMMMNQTTRYHARITMNVVAALLQSLDRSVFDVVAGDFALQTGDDTLRLADIMVTSAEGSGKDRRTDQAVLLVEVLSPSTTTDDFGDKLREYLAIPTLQAYLIVAQDARCVWAWIRGKDGFPDKPEIFEADTEVIEVPALGLSLTLRAIYDRVVL